MNRRAVDPGFDPRIADWLEDDPDHAPDAVLETVLAAFPSIPQRRAIRAARRPTTMNRYLLVGAAAAIVVAVAFGGSLLLPRPPDVGPSLQPSQTSRPSASPSATPLPTPESSGVPELSQSVTTPSGDLTIRYPAGWSELGGDVATAPGAIGGEFKPTTDQPSTAFFAGSSVPLSKGESAEDWLARQEGGCGGQSSVPSDVPIGGRAGALLSSDCPILGGRVHYLAVVVANGRGYTFHMDSRTSTINRAWFTAMLAAASFGP